MTCETESRIVLVPVVVEPVPVHLDLAVVLDEIRGVEIAIMVPHERAGCHPCHQPLNSLKLEPYSASIMP